MARSGKNLATLAGLTAGGLISVGTMQGCTVEQAAGILFGVGAAGSNDPKAAQAMAFAGSALVQGDAANRGRDRIEIYNGDRSRNNNENGKGYVQSDEGHMISHHPEIGRIDLITCERYQDLNNNNLIDVPSDFLGIREKFNSTRPWTCNIIGEELAQARDYSILIVNSFGRPAGQAKGNGDELTRGVEFNINAGALPSDDYHIIFSHRGNVLGILPIHIIE